MITQSIRLFTPGSSCINLFVICKNNFSLEDILRLEGSRANEKNALKRPLTLTEDWE